MQFSQSATICLQNLSIQKERSRNKNLDDKTRSSNKIHALILRSAVDANVKILGKFITACGKLSSIRHARHLFDNRSNRDDTFLCNSMIEAHVGMRQLAHAFTLYKDLSRETCFVPDNFTFTVLAKCCALRMAVWEGLEMHSHVVKIGFCFDMYVSTALVDMYAKFGDLGLARRVFSDMTDRSLVSWTALIGGNDGNYVMVRNLYAMEERWKDVKEIKGLMRRSGAKKGVDSRVSEFIKEKVGCSATELGCREPSVHAISPE
ncbi:hypothetical protein OIU84_015811 [Salix udensis]|uniref:Pentatricopeptide repeat-containing protein n=1 Tax=Salix udensis TaxID=889485 RepID=A0AAD6J894_9ROSI|nr:hypothetical protein OIU84_015811 [Salix udensis]